MKKVFTLLFVLICITQGCNKSKPAEYTILGDYTPYGGSIEKMNGKVQKVIEKAYWTVSEKDTIKKGNLITTKERDSLKWSYDYEANFDMAGDLVSCNYFDENNKMIGSWQFFKKDNKLDSVKGTYRDTVNIYQKLKCNDKGIIIEAIQHSINPDTLMYTWVITTNKAGDTVLYTGTDSKGNFDTKVLNLYNEKGQFVSWESFKKDGIFDGSNKVLYDEKGKSSEIINFDKDKKVTDVYHMTYPEYDTKGNWLKAITKDTKGHTILTERVYTYY